MARAVLQRFGEVRGLDRIGTREIGDGASYLQQAVVGASGEAEALARRFQEALAGFVQDADAAHLARTHVGVAREFRTSESRSLASARLLDPFANNLRALWLTSTGQLLEVDAWHLDVQVDAIQQRTTDSLRIPRDLDRSTSAVADCIA